MTVNDKPVDPITDALQRSASISDALHRSARARLGQWFPDVPEVATDAQSKSEG